MQKFTAKAVLLDRGFADLELRYGENGETPMPFHNANHSLDVHQGVQTLAELALEADKIKASDVPVLELAACYHDWERTKGSVMNEQISAVVLAARMEEMGTFSHHEIKKAIKMIMATVVEIKPGVFRQSAANNYLNMLLADADVANFGQDFSVFWNRSMDHWSEIHQNRTDPTPSEIFQFMADQIDLLNAHQFYTPEAEIAFPHKQANISFLLDQMAA